MILEHLIGRKLYCIKSWKGMSDINRITKGKLYEVISIKHYNMLSVRNDMNELDYFIPGFFDVEKEYRIIKIDKILYSICVD